MKYYLECRSATDVIYLPPNLVIALGNFWTVDFNKRLLTNLPIIRKLKQLAINTYPQDIAPYIYNIKSNDY
jgi:hypothetical protein